MSNFNDNSSFDDPINQASEELSEPVFKGPNNFTPPKKGFNNPFNGFNTKLKFLIPLAAIFGLYILLFAIWAISNSGNSDKVVNGTYISETDVSGMDVDEINNFTKKIANDFADEKISITVTDLSETSTLGELGLSINSDKLSKDALANKNEGFILFKPIGWLFGRQDKTDIPITINSIEDGLGNKVTGLFDENLSVVEEPQLIFEDNEISVSPGKPGISVDTSNIDTLFSDAINTGDPYSVNIPSANTEPTVSLEKAEQLAEDANNISSEPILISVLDKVAELKPNEIKTMFEVRTDEKGQADWHINQEIAVEILKSKLPNIGGSNSSPVFKIIDNRPVLIPSSKNVTCCNNNTAEMIKKTLSSEPKKATLGNIPQFPSMAAQCKRPGRSFTRSSGYDRNIRRGKVEPKFINSDPTYEKFMKLGIVEEVSSCTTAHNPGQDRVKNIQRFADIMNGAVVGPGQTLSLNKKVGKRTVERGFVGAGAIIDGVVVDDDVGGGISQFITTFFNAAFFSGSDLVQYQSHSIYIDRYPRGLEATISWGGPEQIMKNNSKYGILVWTEHTPTSVTVTFYSTKFRNVKALTPVEEPYKEACKKVRVGRNIDGKVNPNAVVAIYRDTEGYSCDGEPTKAQLEKERLEEEEGQDPDNPNPENPDPDPDNPDPDPENPDPDPENPEPNGPVILE